MVQRLTKYRTASTTTIKTMMPTIPSPPTAAIMSPPFSGTGYPERPSPNLVRINLVDQTWHARTTVAA